MTEIKQMKNQTTAHNITKKHHHVGMPHLQLHEIAECLFAATETTATVCAVY